MTFLRKFAIPAAVAVLLFMANIPPEPSRYPLGIQLISEAEAIFGVRRRTRRRALFFGYEAGRAAAMDSQQGGGSQSSSGSQSNSGSQSSTASQTSTTSQKSEASQKTTESKHTAAASTSQPAKTSKPLPLGEIVHALPSGCSPTSSGGIEYYHCGPDYYRAVFQGSSLIYVTTKP
jgi:hypothetical protein